MARYAVKYEQKVFFISKASETASSLIRSNTAAVLSPSASSFRGKLHCSFWTDQECTFPSPGVFKWSCSVAPYRCNPSWEQQPQQKRSKSVRLLNNLTSLGVTSGCREKRWSFPYKAEFSLRIKRVCVFSGAELRQRPSVAGQVWLCVFGAQ